DHDRAGGGEQESLGVVCGGGEGGLRLIVAPAREPLLTLTARLAAALHVTTPGLACVPLAAVHPGDGEATFAHQEHAPVGWRRGLGEEGVDLSRSVVRPPPGKVYDGTRAVG